MVSLKFTSTFLVIPNPNPYSVGIAIVPTAFLGLEAQFLKSLLEPVKFLDQLGKRLFSRIEFLSAFLSGMETDLLQIVFLILSTLLCVVRSMHTPMLLAEITMLLKADFLGDSGHRPSTRSLAFCHALAGNFLVGLCVGFFLHKYTLYCLKRCKKQTYVHRGHAFLVEV